MGSANMVIPVSDMAAASAHYAAVLGVQPYVSDTYYTAFTVGDFEVGLVPEGAGAAATYVEVADLDVALAAAERTGAVVEPAREVGGGRRVAIVADAGGQLLGLRAG